MSFEERFAADGPPDEEPEPEPEHVRPVWLGPPEDELGVVVAQNALIGRSDRGAIALSHVTAYSNGVALDFQAQARGLRQSEANRLFHEQHRFEPGAALPDGMIRLGVELADGTRASNVGGRPHRRLFAEPGATPDRPVFFEHGGGGGMSSASAVSMRPGYWLWPLPPPGPLTIWCEWPALGITLSSTELDATALVEAAGRATPFWRD